MKNALLSLLILSSGVLFAQNESGNSTLPKAVSKNGLWGFVDQNDNPLTPIQYSKVDDFEIFGWSDKGPYSVVYKNGKQGLVNTQGVEIMKPIYDLVYTDPVYLLGKLGNRIIAITENGEIITPAECSYVKEFRSNTFLIKKGNKYGLINDLGKITLNPIYDTIRRANGVNIVKQGAKYGLVNLDGTVAQPVVYDHMEIDSYLDYLSGTRGRNMDLISLSGKKLIDSAQVFKYNYDLQQMIVSRNGKIGHYSITGETWIVEPKYTQVHVIPGFNEFPADQIKPEDRLLWGNLGTEQNPDLVLAFPQGESIRADRVQFDPSNSWLTFSWQGKSGIMDLNGNVKIPAKYETIEKLELSYPYNSKHTELDANPDYKIMASGPGIQLYEITGETLFSDELSKQLNSITPVSYDREKGYIFNICKTDGKCAVFNSNLEQLSGFDFDFFPRWRTEAFDTKNRFQKSDVLVIPAMKSGKIALFDVRSKKLITNRLFDDFNFFKYSSGNIVGSGKTEKDSLLYVDTKGKIYTSFVFSYPVISETELPDGFLQTRKKAFDMPGPDSIITFETERYGDFYNSKINGKNYLFPEAFDGTLYPYDKIVYSGEEIDYDVFALVLNGKYGVIDDLGLPIYPPKFDWAFPVEINGSHFVIFKAKGKYGLLNLYGDTLLPPVHSEILYDVYHKNNIPYAEEQAYFSVKSSSSWQLYDPIKQKFIFQPFTKSENISETYEIFSFPDGTKNIVAYNEGAFSKVFPTPVYRFKVISQFNYTDVLVEDGGKQGLLQLNDSRKAEPQWTFGMDKQTIKPFQKLFPDGKKRYCYSIKTADGKQLEHCPIVKN